MGDRVSVMLVVPERFTDQIDEIMTDEALDWEVWGGTATAHIEEVNYGTLHEEDEFQAQRIPYDLCYDGSWGWSAGVRSFRPGATPEDDLLVDVERSEFEVPKVNLAELAVALSAGLAPGNESDVVARVLSLTAARRALIPTPIEEC